MSLKSYKPTTKSMRSTIIVDRSSLWKGKPEKTLTKYFNRSVGRNNLGRITTRHKSMGHKKKYRNIDFFRKKTDMMAVIKRFEYDPFRSANIMLVEYEDKTLNYQLAPDGLSINDKVISGEKVDIKTGNCMPIKNIPAGTQVYNIELSPGRGGKLVRSAGSFAQVMGQDQDYTIVKLGSGETRKIFAECRATIGQVSNPDNKNTSIGKAGRSRWMGIRPGVRGIAMNPVDHPHGGRTNGGRNPVTPWGQGTRGLKTRKNKRTDKFILSRKKGNKVQ